MTQLRKRLIQGVSACSVAALQLAPLSSAWAAQPAPTPTASVLSEASPEQSPPVVINLLANEQGFDQRLNRFVAKGDVQLDLAGGRVLADRLEYETATRTLLLSGRVRFQRGEQYFQANSLRYSLIENSGDADAVYGVIDFDTSEVDFDLKAYPSVALPSLSYWPTWSAYEKASFSTNPPRLLRKDLKGNVLVDVSWAKPANAAELALAAHPLEAHTGQVELKGLALQGLSSSKQALGLPDKLSLADWRVPPMAVAPAAQSMACTPLIPPVPDWHPHPSAVTAWAFGQAIDANFGNSFTFNGRWRPENVWGLNYNQRLVDAGPLALEFDSNALLHKTSWQPGGEFNNSEPFAPLPPKTFGEFTAAFGLRAWLQPWLSLGFFEGVSLLTSNSLYEQTFRQNYQTFLNYLGFEVEALVKPQWSVVGRLHHRSGAYGTYGGVSEGSNAYLVGVRYRYGRSKPPRIAPLMPPAASCPGAPSTGEEQQQKPLADQLNAVAEAKPQQATGTSQPPALPPLPTTPAAQLEAERHKAIEAIADQRISDLYYIRSLKLERRQGGGFLTRSSEEDAFGSVKPNQLDAFSGDQKLIEGFISRWRFQAARIQITPDGWTATRAAFSNDPFTPAQSWIDLEDVVAVQETEERTKISAKRSRLVLENRLPIPMRKNIVLEQDQPADSPWVIADDGIDRSGIYFGYDMKEIELKKARSFTNKKGVQVDEQPLKLKIQPQFMVARALNGNVNSFVLPGDPIGGPTGSQPAQIGDLFGALIKLEGSVFGYSTSDFTLSLPTLNPQNMANGTRSWGDFSRQIFIPKLGIIPAGTYTTRLFGAYRYKTYNGSLGQQDVYSALGASIERQGDLNPWWQVKHNYYWRAAFGNFQGNSFGESNLIDSTRGSFFGAVNSSLQIWQAKYGDRNNPKTTQNTPNPITPGLRFNTNVSTRLDFYGDGTRQLDLSLSGGPTLTLGRFEKNFFDYTELTISGGGTLQQGESPFSFDRNVDLATLGIGLRQQLVGPLLISGGLGVNVDPSSPYYGDFTNAYGELVWSRRGYEFAIYYSPYEQVGGVRVKLNDFNYRGTGLPFVPYTPTDFTKKRQGLY
ncbi:DUF3769 domain-containing protein [Synechococcus sp. LTW-R]|uniref:DUF3769 domain-containing protein n=2 Tax=Synechococcaceae TaxID=1890426 RepID=UPI001629DA5D|nr:DUF3769 domain-containing protein [Synechococcus sp. LTW-R]QNG28882.1 DUF3769 domain-containing protein [Synechococcus sp. LTW-R]